MNMNLNSKIKWKKTTKHLKRSKHFNEDFSESDSENELWLPKYKPPSIKATNKEAGLKLKQEGTVLAEKGFFREALTKWNKAVEHLPDDHTIHEMQAQVLIMLDKDMAACQACEKSLLIKKNWSEGWQTLARSQLNIQDHPQALQSFCRALHLNPADCEIRKELYDTSRLLKEIMSRPTLKIENNDEVENITL